MLSGQSRCDLCAGIQTEVLLRSLAIHVISLISYGHSMSMQGPMSLCSWKSAAMILLFFLFPEWPVAQLVSRYVTTFPIGLRNRCIAVCLRSHAPSAGTSVPLKNINLAHLQYERTTYNITWLRRFVVLVVIFLQ